MRRSVGAPRGDDDAVDAFADSCSTWRASRWGSSVALHMKTAMRLSDRHSSTPSMIGMREAAERVGRDEADRQALAAVQALREIVRAKAESGEPPR